MQSSAMSRLSFAAIRSNPSGTPDGFILCAPAAARTRDLVLKRDLLYQLSYGRVTTTYLIYRIFLVRERINRVALLIEKLDNFMGRTEEACCAAEIDAPGVAREVLVVLVRVYTTVIVQIFNKK